MPSKASQVVLVQNGDGFLNGLIPDFARMLDDQLSSFSALGSILSERSYRGDVLRFNQWRGDRPIDKAPVEKKYLKNLSRQEYSPSYTTRILASIRCYVNRIRDLLLDDATIRSLLPPEERKTIIETAERCLVAKAPRDSRAVGIEAGRYIPLAEFHQLMEERLQDDSKARARNQAMIALAWQLGPHVHEIAGLIQRAITMADGHIPSILRSQYWERQQAVLVQAQTSGQFCPVHPELAGSTGRGAFVTFPFCFLPREPEKAGLESRLEDITQDYY